MERLRQLFGTRPRHRQVTEVPGDPPRPETTVGVVGDVHGSVALLTDLLARLDSAGVEQIVTVGDYIDRGDHARAVLELLRTRQETAPESFVCLMGNHENMMLEFLDRPEARGARWLRNGGLQTLASFGVGQVAETSGPEARAAARDRLRAALPEGLEDWLRQRPLTWSSGNLWVVHGAADPRRPMTDQDSQVLLWGHPDFLRLPRDDGQWVAHGHTVFETPHQAQSRIATDTGAYFSGRLTAARITSGGQVDFLQAGAG